MNKYLLILLCLSWTSAVGWSADPDGVRDGLYFSQPDSLKKVHVYYSKGRSPREIRIYNDYNFPLYVGYRLGGRGDDGTTPVIPAHSYFSIFDDRKFQVNMWIDNRSNSEQMEHPNG